MLKFLVSGSASCCPTIYFLHHSSSIKANGKWEVSQNRVSQPKIQIGMVFGIWDASGKSLLPLFTKHPGSPRNGNLMETLPETQEFLPCACHIVSPFLLTPFQVVVVDTMMFAFLECGNVWEQCHSHGDTNLVCNFDHHQDELCFLIIPWQDCWRSSQMTQRDKKQALEKKNCFKILLSWYLSLY